MRIRSQTSAIRGSFFPRPLDVPGEFFDAQIPAQQDFVAHREDIGVPGTRDLKTVRELDLVFFHVGAEPDADHRLQTHFVGDAGRRLVTLDAREGADPPRAGPDDGHALADLLLRDLRARGLTVDVRAEGNAVDSRFENLAESCQSGLTRFDSEFPLRELRDRGREKARPADRSGAGFLLDRKCVAVASRHRFFLAQMLRRKTGDQYSSRPGRPCSRV